MKMKGQFKYNYLVLGRDNSYFLNKNTDCNKEFSVTDIIKMLDFI